MLGKLISFWVAIPLAIILGLAPGIWLTEWWEHDRTPPAFSTGHFLFWHWSFVPLAMQRDTALEAYAEEKHSFDTVYAALIQQNAAVRHLASQSEAWQAASQTAERQVTAANAWRLTAASRIMATPEPADMTDAAKCSLAETILRNTAP